MAGAGWLLCLSVFNLAAQQVLPDWVRARGLALNLTVTAGATAAGGAAWGAVANVLGVSGAFAWGSLAVARTLLAGVRWRFSSIATYDLSPAPLTEPDTPLAVWAGGPVFVTGLRAARVTLLQPFLRAPASKCQQVADDRCAS